MIDPISREYLSLSFAIERLFPGFVDAYFGPPEIQEAAQSGAHPDPEELLARATSLGDDVAAGSYPETRKAFLLAQIGAMATICRRLADQPIDYVDEVRSCLDIEPAYTPESVFEAAITELNELLPGEGDVRERMIEWRANYVVGTEAAGVLIGLIEAETRRRTEAFVQLPPGDGFEVAFVADKPWSGYNWYLGDYRSRVDVNTDLPIHAHELTALIAHEGYPGHHTEHALKEQVLYHERGYGEHAIQLINTPECVISEGIATLAEGIVFPGDEGARWQAATLYPAAGIAGDPDREERIAKARTALRAVGGNAALRLHAEGQSEDEVVDYLMRYGLRSEREARQSLRFIADPLWRPYIFTYHVGRDLLGAWLNRAPADERRARFAWLLTEQTTPSQIAAQVSAA
ncbi:MAG: hypothetical protein IT336_07695 [Thermomicrobiales bacterium]|nr:hypothetical protein [Thermomicrobiales bacterium]